MRAYRSFVVVSAQEIEQRVHAVLVLEQFRREVAIEKLHSVADGFRQRRAREGSIEGLEIQLQLEVALAADQNDRDEGYPYVQHQHKLNKTTLV